MQMSLATIRRGLSIGACLLILTPCAFAEEGKGYSGYSTENLTYTLGGTNYTLTGTRFPEVTRWTAAKWAAQVAFAPETLTHVVPMYVYSVKTLGSSDLDDLDYLLNNEDSYIAILPPRDEEQTKPAACGFSVTGEKELGKFIELIKSVTDDKEAERLAHSSNCLIDKSKGINSVENWYIATSLNLATSLALKKSFADADVPFADVARVWTKTGAW